MRVGSSMVEQRPFKALVAGSSPAQPTFFPWFLSPISFQKKMTTYSQREPLSTEPPLPILSNAMSTPTASEQIEQLEKRILELKHQALAELKEKLVEARKTVAALEAELSELTGKPASESGATTTTTVRRTRRPSISDDDLKPQVLKAMAQFGATGLNAKEISMHVGQDPLRVRKFIANNPTALKPVSSCRKEIR